MEHRLLVPLGDLYRNASGVVEKHIYYCVDFVCTFVLQDRTRKCRDEVAVLFDMYLNMLIENECDEEDIANTTTTVEAMADSELFEFVWQLYQTMYPYLAPVLLKAEWYIYTMDNLQIINNNLFVHLDLDGDEDEPCSLANLPPLNSSI